MAYGARLESVLGASPRGFESLSLRQRKMTYCQVGHFSLRDGGSEPGKRAQRTEGFGRARTRAGVYSEHAAMEKAEGRIPLNQTKDDIFKSSQSK